MGMGKMKAQLLLMTFVVVSSAVAFAVAQDCSRSKSCPDGQCCSQFGFCGCTDAYCGSGCQSQCGNCGECSAGKPCPGGECCSQFGFCGCTDAYCGSGCQSQCGNCGGGGGSGECSAGKPCPGGECCSQFGFCGCTDAYCGSGCQGQCGNCGGGGGGGQFTGQATFYTEYVPSACYGFDQGPFPPGPLIAAASPDLYNNGAICGSFYDITCKGAASGGSNPCTGNPTVRVKVVDLCPGCHQNSFDLSQQAFAKIADLNAGRLTITAKKVSGIGEELEAAAEIVQVV